MKDLWQATTFLFWRYPVLWAPVLVADFLNVLCRMLQRNLDHKIVLWVWSRYGSVLGGSPDPIPAGAVTRKVVLLASPVNLLSNYAQFCLYAAALIVTSTLVSELQIGSTPRFRVVLPVLTNKLRDIFVLSLKVMTAFAVLMFVPAISFAPLYGVHPHLGTVALGLFLALLAFAVAPAAVRALQAGNAAKLSSATQQRCRLFAAACVAISVAVGCFCGVATSSIRGLGSTDHTLGRFVTQLGFSWATALPYVFLFIGLAQLVDIADSSRSLERASCA